MIELASSSSSSSIVVASRESLEKDLSDTVEQRERTKSKIDSLERVISHRAGGAASHEWE
jgi:hypothetical protein